ncbi:MAG: SLC13 family permease [Planctomycetales bacterium]|nr:SLC13 family permease [Planctomycetales bacterium]
MGWQGWYTVAVLLLTLGLLAWGKTSPAAIMWGAVAMLFGAGILDEKSALGGLANEGMVTVAVLYIVGAGISETGAIDFLAQRVLGNPKSPTVAVARLMIPTAAISAFINNTPLVAMLIPIVNDWAKKNRVPVSKLMLPLSIAAILGGSCSLIGTSTNLVVAGLYKQRFPGEAIGMFDISPIGIPAALIGCAFVIFTSRWLLPDRRPALSQLTDPRQYTVEMLVDPASPLVGKTIEEAGLRHLPGSYLAEIDRDGMVLPAVSPEERLRGNDRLVFVGVVESVVDLQRTRGLKPATDQVFKLDSPRAQRCLIEAVISNTCSLVGKTIRDAKFRSNYNAVVLAVARNGERLPGKIGDIEVTTGDTLLLEAHPSFVNQHRNSRDFFLVSQLQDSHPPKHDKAGIALTILVAMVLAASINWAIPTNWLRDAIGMTPIEKSMYVPMLNSAVIAGALILLTGCCSVEQAKRNLNSDVLLAIAASLAISKRLESTGAAKLMAESMTNLAGGSPWAALAMVYLGTLLVTEAVTNNAAAALMFPLSIATAAKLGVSHYPFVIAIMMAASNGFATPIGYQTNLMVYGPGGYRFSDYLRIGIPLDILIGIIAVALAPLVYPFSQ